MMAATAITTLVMCGGMLVYTRLMQKDLEMDRERTRCMLADAEACELRSQLGLLNGERSSGGEA